MIIILKHAHLGITGPNLNLTLEFTTVASISSHKPAQLINQVQMEAISYNNKHTGYNLWERERETDRDIDREGHRQRETKSDSESQKQRQIDRERWRGCKTCIHRISH